MPETRFEDIPQSMDYTDQDATNVRSLASEAIPVIPAVVSGFYEYLQRHESARATFAGGQEQMVRLRGLLSVWLREVFEADFDAQLFKKRRRIGTAHVRSGVPQYYMVTGIELIWQDLYERLRDRNVPEDDARLRSLHKRLMIELAVMLQSYKESHTEHVRDVERSAVEAKLTRAEHLAEIGQLAASLAHEIKNPLAGISGAIQIIGDGIPPDHAHQPIVTEILGQIGRLDATVKDLLQYARPTPPRAAKVELDGVVRRVLRLLQEEPALQRVRIMYDSAEPDASVYADDAQIEQLLINLLLNAAHASDSGAIIRLGVARPGDCVILTVRDEGKGMTTEALARAFEPFFTTKARGTGLGLPICKRIVEAHGGDIKLQSELGQGTTVTVHLPLSSREEDQQTPS